MNWVAQRKLGWLSALLVLLLAPSVSAAPMLDPVVRLISSITTIPALQNPAYLQGFYRLVFFILFMSVFNWALRKVFKSEQDNGLDKRTANIVSVILALIAALATPVDYILALGNWYMIIVLMIATLWIPALLIYFGFQLKGTPEEPSRIKEFMGLLMVLLAFLLFQMIQDNFANLILQRGQGATWWNNFFLGTPSQFQSWVSLIFLILIIWKLIRVFSGGAVGGDGIISTFADWARAIGGGGSPPGTGGNGGAGGGGGGGGNDRPSHPTGINGFLLPPHPQGQQRPDTTHLALWWNQNPDSEGVTGYNVYVVKPARWWRAGARGVASKWHLVQENVPGATQQQPFQVDLRNHYNNTWIRGRNLWNGRNSLQVKVRAVSPTGKSPWRGGGEATIYQATSNTATPNVPNAPGGTTPNPAPNPTPNPNPGPTPPPQNPLQALQQEITNLQQVQNQLQTLANMLPHRIQRRQVRRALPFVAANHTQLVARTYQHNANINNLVAQLAGANLNAQQAAQVATMATAHGVASRECFRLIRYIGTRI